MPVASVFFLWQLPLFKQSISTHTGQNKEEKVNWNRVISCKLGWLWLAAWTPHLQGPQLYVQPPSFMFNSTFLSTDTSKFRY